MKMMLARAALVLLACSGAPVAAQHASTSSAPAGYAPEQACVTWSGTTIGAGLLVPCPAAAGGGGAAADVFTTGSLALAGAGNTFEVAIANGQNAVTMTMSGLTGSGATLVVEGNSAGSGAPQWTTMYSYPASTGSPVSAFTADGAFSVNVAARTRVRLRVSVAGTGTATITANASVAVRDVGIDKPLPPGANTIGAITVASGSSVIAMGQYNSGTLPGGVASGGYIAPQTDGYGNLRAYVVGAPQTIADGGTTVNFTEDRSTQATSGMAPLGVLPYYVTSSGARAYARGDANGAFVQAASLPLPAGAATAGAQATLNATIGTPGSAAPGTGLLIGGTDGANYRALRTGTDGVLTLPGITGNAGSGSTDSGNPVKVGGRYNATLPTLTDGQRADLQVGNRGQLLAGYAGSSLSLGGNSTSGAVLPYDQSNTGRPIGVVSLLYTGATQVPSPGTTDGTATTMGLGSTALGGAAPSTTYASTGATLKTTAGNVASVNVVNSTVAGYLILANLTAVPASGTAITAAQNEYCMPVAAGVGFRDTFQVPIFHAAGITALFSTSCTTYTPVGTAPVQITVQFK